MNIQLYNELLEAEVFRCRAEIARLNTRSELRELETKTNRKITGAARGDLFGGVSDHEIAETLAQETFAAAKNLGDGPIGYDANGSPSE